MVSCVFYLFERSYQPLNSLSSLKIGLLVHNLGYKISMPPFRCNDRPVNMSYITILSGKSRRRDGSQNHFLVSVNFRALSNSNFQERGDFGQFRNHNRNIENHEEISGSHVTSAFSPPDCNAERKIIRVEEKREGDFLFSDILYL